MSTELKETIFALATPAGKSGVAVIRLSGPRACAALESLTHRDSPAPNSAIFTKFYAPSGTLVDAGIALYFKAPKSFTGEDVVELQVHGSLAVIRELLEALSQIDGLRPAEPGEFTRRAFINGKMDLTQAEGLADLIDAATPAQKSQAMRQMEGDLSGFYDSMRNQIVTALAHMEAYIDFPDEEIPESVLLGLNGEVLSLKATIEKALADNRRGEALREGLHIVILGAPNAGKSSLLNLLAGRDAAIVSHKPGTTRDVIEVQMDMAGFPVVLTDTAGLRETADDIEQEGVRRALSRAGEADIKLVLFDASELPALNPASAALIDERTLIVLNKSELCHPGEGRDPRLPEIPAYAGMTIQISTKTGQGVDALLAALSQKVSAFFSGDAAPMITRSRHRALLLQAFSYLERFDVAQPLELACENLRQSALCLGKITGKIEVDDVLDVVFRQFCIGK